MLKRKRCNRRRQLEVPSRPKRNLHWIHGVAAFILLDILVLFAWAGSRLMDPAFAPIREVRVVGEFRQLRPERLRSLVAEQIRGGFFAIDVSAVKAAVLQEPWVEALEVRRVWPAALQVTVLERRAVARWGTQGLLTADGVLFRPLAESYPAGLVLLDGPAGSERHVLQKLTGLRRALAGMNQEVTALSLNSRRSWSFVLRDGPIVHVGRTDFETRIQRFADHFQALVANSPSRIERVDLRYTNGFSVFASASANDANG